MSDCYGKFNHQNKTLQGKNLNLVKVKSNITSFRNQVEPGKKKSKIISFYSLQNFKFQKSECEVEVFSSHL